MTPAQIAKAATAMIGPICEKAAASRKMFPDTDFNDPGQVQAFQLARDAAGAFGFLIDLKPEMINQIRAALNLRVAEEHAIADAPKLPRGAGWAREYASYVVAGEQLAPDDDPENAQACRFLNRRLRYVAACNHSAPVRRAIVAHAAYAAALVGASL